MVSSISKTNHYYININEILSKVTLRNNNSLNISSKGRVMLPLQNICVINYHGDVPFSRYHNPVYSSFMVYQLFCNKSSTTGGTTSLTGTPYTSGAPEFTPNFIGDRVPESLVLCGVFLSHCLSLCSFSFGEFDLRPFITLSVFSNFYTYLQIWN